MNISKKQLTELLKKGQRHILGNSIIPLSVAEDDFCYISLGSLKKAMAGEEGPLSPIEGSAPMDYADWELVIDKYLEPDFKAKFTALGENELCFLFAKGFHIPVTGAIPALFSRRDPVNNKKVISFLGVALNRRPEFSDCCKVFCEEVEYTYYQYGNLSNKNLELYITKEELELEGAIKDVSEFGLEWDELTSVAMDEDFD